MSAEPVDRMLDRNWDEPVRYSDPAVEALDARFRQYALGSSVFAPHGMKIGAIHLPEGVSNLCFGGEKRPRLFMTGSQSICSLYVETQGVPYV